MENHAEAIAVLESAFLEAEKGSGGTVLIRGESGIGKTFLIKQFSSSHEDDCFLVKTRGLPAAQPALSSIYESLFDLASKKHVSRSMYVSLLSRYSKLLPGFGQYIVPLVGLLKADALQEVIARSGVAFGTSPAAHVVRFVQELAGKRTVLWVVDDAQWVDSESWSCVVHIVNKARALGWCIVLGFNDKTEQWQPEGFDIELASSYWQQHSDELSWTGVEAKRWTVEALPSLCAEILGKPCALSPVEIQQLHDYTSGIPLYVASALDVLKNDGRLTISGEVWKAGSEWRDLDIHQPIREALERRLKAAYSAVPNSRESLEVASVIGQIFNDDTIDSVLAAGNCYKQLCEIEQRFRIIEYIVAHRYWTFDHNLIRESIYRSLGHRAKRIHLQLAKILEASEDANVLTIAFHYEQAGEYEQAVRFKLREAERLLGGGLFLPALSVVDHVRGLISAYKVRLPSDLSTAVDTVHGRLLFHTRQYQEALNLFASLLQGAKALPEEALFHRWVGRCLLKLHSPDDFRQSVKHLQKATALYKEMADLSAEGDTHTDLVVAHAHLNQFDRAEQSFKDAEACFDRAGDQLGMARLQRRNVIFMESVVAAPILERLAHSFEEWGVPHEVVMSLNNAATEYLYLGEYDKAAELLSRAMRASVDIGDFGIAYLYCNLAVTSIVRGRHEQARECIRQARIGRLRTVEELILDTADGVLVAVTSGFGAGKAIFARILTIADTTGEQVYVMPTKINLATCLRGMGLVPEAVEVLESLKPREENTFSSYNNRKWFRLLAACYSQLGQESEREKFEAAFAWCDLEKPPSSYYEYPFALIDMQFWSD
ncbi:MAG TPA: AAA family ATPase [Verrucomicrobiae bacterium]|nr:AAA family ATPase [Verrucomicrobiae bacterium]